jgi:hypothetical protein
VIPNLLVLLTGPVRKVLTSLVIGNCYKFNLFVLSLVWPVWPCRSDGLSSCLLLVTRSRSRWTVVLGVTRVRRNAFCIFCSLGVVPVREVISGGEGIHFLPSVRWAARVIVQLAGWATAPRFRQSCCQLGRRSQVRHNRTCYTCYRPFNSWKG